MIHISTIDPVAFHLGPLAIRWYGISYIAGIGLAWWLLNWRAKSRSDWNADQVGDLVVNCAFGAVLGGRLGYILFYNFSTYLSDPLSVLKVWQGGMSFHGGLLGVFIAIALFARKIDKSFYQISDFIAPVVPVGLFFGRIANFINNELWGAPTDAPWGVVIDHPRLEFPARHPSQLYEAFLEGLILFLILWIFSRTKRPLRAVSGLFLIGYGVFRILVEFVRLPDAHIGYIAFGWLTEGQVLSIPMVLFGLWLVRVAYQKKALISDKGKDSDF